MVVTIAGLLAFVKDPPFHSNVALLLAVSVAEMFLQLRLVFVAVTNGDLVFDETDTTVEAVQPFPSVAITVYEPAALTVAGLAAFTNDPPFQAIELALLVAVRVAVVLVHVKFVVAAVSCGAMVSLITITVAVLLQVFEASETVTV